MTYLKFMQYYDNSINDEICEFILWEKQLFLAVTLKL